MTLIETLEDIAILRENVEVECKLAQGRDGKGACPESLWESYSAFANTCGGDIFLGLEEDECGQFTLAGIEDTAKVIAEMWEVLNNPKRVSLNLITADSIRAITIEGLDIIQLPVPLATPDERPIYINGNPFGGTYLREHSADIRASDEQVAEMLRAYL